jgi:cytosine/adenosine deaminase-related metal-dependent hydrolase
LLPQVRLAQIHGGRYFSRCPKADILVEDAKIREIRPDIAASGDIAVVDGDNRMVIPGFADTHNRGLSSRWRASTSDTRLMAISSWSE